MEAKVNKDIESLNEMSKENPALLKKMINLRREEIKLKKQDLIKKKTIEGIYLFRLLTSQQLYL